MAQASGDDHLLESLVDVDANVLPLHHLKKQLSLQITKPGSLHGYSTVVEHTTRNLDVAGSNPAKLGFFLLLPLLSISSLYLILLSFSNGVSLFTSLKKVHF